MTPMRTWAPRGPLLLALAVSAVLLASVLLTVRTVGRARDGAARGLASGFSVAGREQLRRPERLDAAELQAFLDEQADEGLRYVATIDADGRVLAEAGTAHGRTTTPGLHAVGDRVRVVERPVAGGRRRPGDGGGRRAVAMVFEFEPLVANQLAADARWLFVAAIAASLVVVALAVWVGRGLRQRERLQVELERGKRLAALGEMSAVLAHELRNPLTSLKGHAQLLEEVLDAGPARTKAGRVVAESERLETLANDLLDFVKTGAVHRAACDPAALVRDAATEAGDGRVDVDATAAPARW
ncbi:MAG: two-component sensor histidine kinase, partial [Myxococcales bacterium]|nr:two-component sensor histidine kinase [Myxococcales bacterium]